MTNKERADKIRKLLGLQGEDTEDQYYRVADVICDLKHYCDFYEHHEKNEDDLDFDEELRRGLEFYEMENEDWQSEKKEEVAEFFGGVVNDKR
tara:strand:+ start:212 stop:490 length:279 start_codon:yes stop_codon:yes gene_type:complete